MMDQVDPSRGRSHAGHHGRRSQGRDPEFDALARSIQPDDLATLVYTSGTTGNSKGAMITHGNMASNLSRSLEMFPLAEGQERLISFLPLSHITARHLDYAMFYRGVVIAYCPNVEMITSMMLEIRPTVFVAVPRVYEKVASAVKAKAAEGFKNKVYNWGMSVGDAHKAEDPGREDAYRVLLEVGQQAPVFQGSRCDGRSR